MVNRPLRIYEIHHIFLGTQSFYLYNLHYIYSHKLHMFQIIYHRN